MNVIDLKNLNNPPSANVPTESPTNPRRRQFLKFILVGIGAFVLGFLTKSLGLSGLFSKTKTIQTPSGSDSEAETENLDNYRIIKRNNQTIFIDKKTNDEVLILD